MERRKKRRKMRGLKASTLNPWNLGIYKRKRYWLPPFREYDIKSHKRLQQQRCWFRHKRVCTCLDMPHMMHAFDKEANGQAAVQQKHKNHDENLWTYLTATVVLAASLTGSSWYDPSWLTGGRKTWSVGLFIISPTSEVKFRCDSLKTRLRK